MKSDAVTIAAAGTLAAWWVGEMLHHPVELRILTVAAIDIFLLVAWAAL